MNPNSLRMTEGKWGKRYILKGAVKRTKEKKEKIIEIHEVGKIERKK